MGHPFRKFNLIVWLNPKQPLSSKSQDICQCKTKKGEGFAEALTGGE